MEKNIVYKPLYSVGEIIRIEEGKSISCAFCQKEIKSDKSELVIHSQKPDNFYHPHCYKEFKKILTEDIFVCY